MKFLNKARLLAGYRRVSNRLDTYGDSNEYFFLSRLQKISETDLNFIQIGANNGYDNDPLFEFIILENMRGILVEPQPIVFQDLCKNYKSLENKLTFHNIAIVPGKSGPLEFFTIKSSFLRTLKEKDANTLHRKASLNENKVVGAIRNFTGDSPKKFVEKLLVPSVGINEFLQKHCNRELDLLYLDCEGTDYQILSAIEFTKLPIIKCIFFESRHFDRGVDDFEGKQFQDLMRRFHRFGYKPIMSNKNNAAVFHKSVAKEYGHLFVRNSHR